MDKNKILDEIFASDPFGLLEIKSASSPAVTADDRLASKFKEISAFYEGHGREPSFDGDIHERQLYSRLKGLREDDSRKMVLEAADKYSLLNVQPKKISTLDDVLADDALGILNSDAENIFDLRHVPKETSMPDYVASRKPCRDFDLFKHLFINCQSDLSRSVRQLYPFKNEQQIARGHFFVLKGVLLYVAEVGKREADENGKFNARLRCIFENGTESDMLLRSLAAELYKNGRRVSEHGDKLLDGFSNISEEDKETGLIYVLSSKSTKPEIKAIRNLYKIGYSEIAIEDRIKNAEQDPTYLMAPVKRIMEFRCFNMNPQKLEQLLHNFFGNSCLNIDVFDNKGNRHTPREWFIAPLDVIEQAIAFILTGEIVDYRYNNDTQEIQNR